MRYLFIAGSLKELAREVVGQVGVHGCCVWASPLYGLGVTSLQAKMVEGHHRKTHSMPNYSKRAVGRPIASPPSVKTVHVVKYELLTVRMTRRINMRTYNKV